MMRPRPATCVPRPEAAFGLIELVIGMVLLTIVLAMSSTQLMGALTGAKTTTEARKADQRVADALELFRSDVQQASSPGRENLSSEELTPYLDPTAIVPASARDVQDVVEATPYRVTVRSEVDAQGSPDRTTRVTGSEFDSHTAQCVTWAVDDEAWLTRTVRSAGAPGGGQGWQITGSGAGEPRGVAHIYGAMRYCDGEVISLRRMLRLAVDGGGTANEDFRCSDRPGSSACFAGRVVPPFEYRSVIFGSTCAPEPVVGGITSGNRRLNWITSVRANFSGRYNAANGGDADAVYTGRDGLASVTIRSRTNTAYYEALQCS